MKREYSDPRVESDKWIYNYILSIDAEYGDDIVIHDCRAELFWALSCIRREMIAPYPIDGAENVLVIGDKFGSITGILCEKAATVVSVVESMESKLAVEHRYRNRKNLSVVCDRLYDSGHFDIVFFNLDYTNNYDGIHTYEYEKSLDLPDPKIYGDKIVLLASRDKADILKQLAEQRGFLYQRVYDPLGNGAILLEASRVNDLSNIIFHEISPIINDKWIRRYGLYLRGEPMCDQDAALIDRVKYVQLDLLQKLLSVCAEHDLTVYPIYGTLLGLIRDGGMIPGDDDIDVALPREDFDKLLGLTGEFTGQYFLQTPYNDDCFFGGYLKLRNTETTAIHPQNWWVNCCEGICIDIFPIDKTYVDEGREQRKQDKLLFMQRMLFAYSYGYFKDFRGMHMLEWKAYKYFGKLFSREKVIDRFYEVMRGGDSKKKLAIYTHYTAGKQSSVRDLPADAFDQSYHLSYEGVGMTVPCGWNMILESRYGEGYMSRRGWSQNRMRHGFYDVDTPYTIYKDRFGGLKNPTSINEPIILFGDGSVFGLCLDYYKSRTHITHLVLLPGEEWHKSDVDGIRVYSWQEFADLDIDRDSYRAVICSADAREAECRLREAGYERYYIFWHDRNWMLCANQTQIWSELREVYHTI